MNTITASPTKLRSGEWGARVNGTVRKGDVITITTRAGKSWQATVATVVWSGNGAAIVATQSRPAHRTTRRAVVDHEDCLSFGSCGPGCDYPWA